MDKGTDPPAVIAALAERRAMARTVKDWPTADALRAEIEAAGWRVVDRGFSYRLEPAHPADDLAGDEPHYGASDRVPSRLDEPASARFSVVVLADDWPADVGRLLDGLRRHAPPRTHVVVVANDPAPEQATRLAAGAPDRGRIAGRDLEIVRTSARLGHAAALNAGIRRAAGSVVVLADASVELLGDALTPLADALDDPSVAVAGGFGLTTADLRRFEESDETTVTAIEGYWLAFRRADYAVLGPLDEAFRFYRNLDIWWSLVLRAAPAGEAGSRIAVRRQLPLVRHEHRGWTALPDVDRDRLSRRNFYRVLDRFRQRADLIEPGPAAGSRT